jgi:hypothetical protein
VIGIVVVGGLATSLVFTLVVLGSWKLHPEGWIHDVTEGREKHTRTGKDIAGFSAIIGTLLVGTTATAWWAGSALDAGFSGRFLAAWLVMIIVNIVDLGVIDIVIYMWVYPSWMVLPGYEPLHSYRAHAVGALRGIVIGIPLALVAAVISSWA